MNRVIFQNSSNELYLTVSERQTLSNPNYLFSFWSHSDKNTYNCIVPIMSSNSRYDLFSLTENTTENLTGGTIHLYTGLYSYSVYEQASATNLNLSSTGGLLERGLMIVSAATAQITYTGSSESLNYTFYTV